MKFLIVLIYLSVCGVIQLTAQNSIDIKGQVHPSTKTIAITQNIQYVNTSKTPLSVIYLTDWNNSYSSTDTPLAKRFAEEFKNTFQFSSDTEKGFTTIKYIVQNSDTLAYNRLESQQDIIKVNLKTPVQPGEFYSITLAYNITLPSDVFTRFGFSDDGNFNLLNWYITPAVYNGEWYYYSNKNLSDLYSPLSNVRINLSFPKSYSLISELNTIDSSETATNSQLILEGNNRIRQRLLLQKTPNFKKTTFNSVTLLSNIDTEGLDSTKVQSVNQKVLKFIINNLGDYPHQKLLITETEYRQDPIYGLNLLPKFIRPFPDTFQYELKVLKTALKVYLQNSLLLHPRNEYWLLESIQTFYLMEYIKTYYPEMKLIGKLADAPVIRWFHAADLKFNYQYLFLQMHMARSNLDQAVTTPKDSLIKFNETIASKYKAAVGYNYLQAYDPELNLKNIIADFVKTNRLNPDVSYNLFKAVLKSKASKPINWFFNTYLSTNEDLDYTIKNARVTGDSLNITLKNISENDLPITLNLAKNDSIIYSQWISDTTKFQEFTLPNLKADKIILNAAKNAPEINLRNNYKNLKGLFNKPIQFRFLKDIEDPDYNQIFFMPNVSYNFYDGLTIGSKLYNKTILTKKLTYQLIPSYGIKSNQLNGQGVISYIHQPSNQKLYYARYGLSGKFNNYAPDLSFHKFSPFIQFRFRDPNNLRKNKFQSLTFSFNSIYREDDPTNKFNDNEPNYNVFSASYGKSDKNLKRNLSWYTNMQMSEKFGKLIFSTSFRKITSANHEYNLRFYGGAFIYNNTPQNSDFFSFALDRPTDYLFEYDYLGRSETTGILSQQFIVAEGGFKSKLQPGFANQWISTINANTTIWKYIYAYADIGLVKNKGLNPKFVYDSGIRLSLVADYFELYFPVYSNLGWEIGQPNYDEKIRFIITLTPKTLLGLFTRRWY